MSRPKPKNKKRRARRKFTPKFKADVVRLCETGAESIADVCRRLDLTETAVRAWVKQAEVDQLGSTSDALTTSEREELHRLRRELKRVTQERDIIKKATAIFAKESS
jgi:transposase